MGNFKGALAIETNTDAYRPIEKKHEIRPECLTVLRDFRHLLAIVTKGTSVARDIYMLSDMARQGQGLVRVGVLVTTLDADLSRRLEPRAPMPQRRLAAIRALSEAGGNVDYDIADHPGPDRRRGRGVAEGR